MIKPLLVIILLCCCTVSLLFADDAYHTYIRSQLSQQYGLTGGTWLLPDTEAKTNSGLLYDNLNIAIQPSSGVETFNQVLLITSPQRRVNSWDAILRFPTTAPIRQSDVLLLIFWINNTDSLESKHEMIFDVELLNDPNERPLYLTHTVRSDWQQWFIPLQVKQDCAAGQARFQLHLGHMLGQFQLAGVAMLNFGDLYSVDELPRSVYHLEYEGQEINAPWRQMALQRIENIRKSPLTINVVNRHDEPIEGARISVDMRRHEFGFGSAISSDMFFSDSHDARIYLKKLENLTGDGRSFNIITLKNALKWPAWEDDYAWGTREQAQQVVQWFADRHIRVRGHNLLWPDWQKMPADLQQHASNAAYLYERIQNHIFDLTTYPGLRGVIGEWDVLNEIQAHDDLAGAFGSRDIYAECFLWAAAGDPAATLYLNENNIITESNSAASLLPVKTFLRTLIEDNVPIHGLGIQGHMTENLTPPEQVLEFLDEFSQFNLDLSITEYDAVAVDEKLAADYMRDLLIAAFSHPHMRNFIMWGFWDGAHWKNDSPIFRQNWSLKPSGRIFLDYVFDQWWSNGEGETDAVGAFQTRGFFGEYAVSISLNGQSVEEQITLSRGRNQFTIQMDTDETTIHYPETFQLYQNNPNPFNSVTSMIYELPRETHVKIDMYDVRGRHVKTLSDQLQYAGRHALRIDGTLLSSGLYYVHMQAGKMQRVKKIVVMK